MEKLKEYIQQILGEQIVLNQLKEQVLNKLPFIFKNNYTFYHTELFNRELILVEFNKKDVLNATQLRKQLVSIEKAIDKRVIIIIDDITAINRKRLIDQKISFIIPGKQMYLTELLIDIQDFNKAKEFQKEFLMLPSAQLIVLYHILHREEDLNQFTFKELAKKFQYTPMGITKAIDNLKKLAIVKVEGTKEKNIIFEKDIQKLWKDCEQLVVNPIMKTVYVDEKPMGLLKSNTTALEEYSDMNPSALEYFAIDKKQFYKLEKSNQLVNLNNESGNYALEVWKYNPVLIANGITKKNNVDPLSLYLSLKDGFIDERTDMALDQIIEKYIW
ncbi:MarR family transcriptional regulator [uncultured Flavobacterium sp.]|uniref:MarR family transcriptional regulator n=1 Tax=uncultured Flavobacterium sp. TaxID=165435 RepID=UPI0030EB908B|tara:strand:- start:1460 stop:2449 length:990 start_codon:yes stop_codon:yes gene_type:complete